MKMKKNKLKTRKSVAKRFKVTSTGKVTRRGAQNRHLAANKSKSAKRRSKVTKEVTNAMSKKIKKMLGK